MITAEIARDDRRAHAQVIPFSNGLDLHAACKAHHPLPPAWIDGGTHNNIESNYSEQYLQVMTS